MGKNTAPAAPTIDPMILEPKEDGVQTNVPAEGEVKYRTTAGHTICFDILLRGQTIYGAWAAGDNKVEFLVPADLVEAMEKHYHFISGNIVRVESA